MTILVASCSMLFGVLLTMILLFLAPKRKVHLVDAIRSLVEVILRRTSSFSSRASQQTDSPTVSHNAGTSGQYRGVDLDEYRLDLQPPDAFSPSYVPQATSRAGATLVIRSLDNLTMKPNFDLASTTLSETLAPPTTGPPTRELIVQRLGQAQGFLMPATDEAIVIGSSPDAAVSILGEPTQAAIVFSDGIALVTRLAPGRLMLGNVEVGPVGVPITPSTNRLLLENALIDLSSFQTHPPSFSLLVQWLPRVLSVGSAQTGSCVSAVLGDTGLALSEKAVSCFSGTGRRAAVWALEAGVGVTEAHVFGCVVGIAEVDGNDTILIAAQAASLVVTLEPTSELLDVTQERAGLHTAEFAIKLIPSGPRGNLRPTQLRVSLRNETGDVLMEGVLQLQPLWEQYAQTGSCPTSSTSSGTNS